MTPGVTEPIFVDLLDRWMADVKVEAVKLFREGVAHDRCTQIAISITDAKDLGRLRRAERFGVPRS